MKGPTSIFLGLAGLVFGGCATQSFTPEQAPENIVIKAFTPFYTIGPLQPRGPDASLPSDERVRLLIKDSGYSLVQLEDGRKGYVANDSLAPAPPRPKPSPDSGFEGEDAGSPGSSTRRRTPNSPRYNGEQVNDTPLPDVRIPPPDLNIGPEVVPTATPTPSST